MSNVKIDYMPIYTKKGDGGNTKTFKGTMSKSDELAEAIGTVDELNSWLGSLMLPELKNVQTNLMKINALLAGSDNPKLKIDAYEIKKMENAIDKMTRELPVLTNFIYPVGTIQVVRTICRRAERRVVAVFPKQKIILKYLNRLSDYLFTLARWENFKNGIKEEMWKV